MKCGHEVGLDPTDAGSFQRGIGVAPL